jgi:outer membrane protein assembly complex protein YaeT
MLSHVRRRCFVAATLLSVPAAAWAQERAPGVLDEDRPEVVDLRISGVRSVDADELRESIRTDASHCRSLVYRITICPFYKGPVVYERKYFDAVEFRRDVLRIKLFYYERGFREAQVDTAVVDAGTDRVKVLVAVTEGAPTRIDTVVVERAGGRLLSRRRRTRIVRVRKGDPLNLLRLDSVKVAIREALGGRGYADAEVGTRVQVDDSARLARVTIAIDPKRRTTVDSIVVRGNEEVSTETILNSLRLQPGAIFRVSDVQESQRTLYESGLFRRADIVATPPTDTTRAQRDSAKTVVVSVQEAAPHAVRTSAGFNTFEFFQLGARYTQYNLLGGARRLDVQGAIGNLGAEQLNRRFIFRNPQLDDSVAGRYFAPTYQASVDVTQRWFGDPRNTISAGVFAQRRSSPLVFVDRGYGATATFTREIAPRLPVSANYRFEISGVEAGDVYFCVNFGVCERPTINALNDPQRLSPVSLTGSADRANDLFSPTRGFRWRTDVEHASKFTVSDFRYNRLSAEGSYYRPTFKGVLAAHLRLGGIKALGSTNAATGVPGASDAALIHPRKRFYAGGSQSVRGYGENQLGPRVLTIPSDSLRGRAVLGNGTVVYGYCAPVNPIETCNPNAGPNAIVVAPGDTVKFGGLEASDFIPRPVGGDGVLEGSLEYRFPLLERFNLFGAVFVDAAVVTGESVAGRETMAAATPGFGVRYRSPVGPIRVDVGINPSLEDELRVITESDAGADRGLLELQGVVATNTTPAVPARRKFAAYQRSGGVGDALGRLVLHLSIGEAF